MIILALRNLSRHRRRTAVVLAAIGFGVVALLLVGGFIEWSFWGMREGTIMSRLGHIQMTRPGYFENGSADPFAYLLSDELQDQLDLQAIPEIETVSPRLIVSGLVSHDDVSIGFIGEGVDPEKDKALGENLIIIEGQHLSAEDANGLLLGGGLARNMGVSVGDVVVLLANTGTGGLNGIEGTVRGLFQSASKEFDDAALLLPLDTAKQLLRVDGTHSWVLILDQTERTDTILQELRARYPEEVAQVEFTPWYKLADFYNKTIELFSRQMNIVRMIVAMIIILGISNSLIMSVMERTGEIGTLLAIGYKRKNILQLFVSEGVLLGIIGGGLGVLVGLMLAYAISAIGIPMPPPPGMDVGFSGKIIVTWPLATGVLLLAVVTTALGSLYPAWKASRMVIVDALRHNR